MKKDIHPKIYNDSQVKCVCGNTYTTISTIPSIQVDICSACHPFYTGQQKFVDTEGRIEKFNKKLKNAQVKKDAAETVKSAKKAKTPVIAKSSKNTSLKEMLKQVKEEEATEATPEQA